MCHARERSAANQNADPSVAQTGYARTFLCKEAVHQAVTPARVDSKRLLLHEVRTSPVSSAPTLPLPRRQASFRTESRRIAANQTCPISVRATSSPAGSRVAGGLFRASRGGRSGRAAG